MSSAGQRLPQTSCAAAVKAVAVTTTGGVTGGAGLGAPPTRSMATSVTSTDAGSAVLSAGLAVTLRTRANTLSPLSAVNQTASPGVNPVATPAKSSVLAVAGNGCAWVRRGRIAFHATRAVMSALVS